MLIDEGGHPGRELAGFSGFLQADAYSGFAGLYTGNRVSEVACWAHFRRELFERHKQQPIALTTDLLDRIAQLYAVEAEIRGQPAEARRSIRQERSQPLVTALRAAFDDALHRLAPKSLTAKAIRYGTKRWDGFTRFLDDGRLEIDNSEQGQQGVRGTACPANAERAIRPIAVGRKNWLFARFRRRRRARGRHLFRHRDGHDERPRVTSLYRRRHRQDRRRLASFPLGRAHALELDSRACARQPHFY